MDKGKKRKRTRKKHLITDVGEKNFEECQNHNFSIAIK